MEANAPEPSDVAVTVNQPCVYNADQRDDCGQELEMFVIPCNAGQCAPEDTYPTPHFNRFRHLVYDGSGTIFIPREHPDFCDPRLGICNYYVGVYPVCNGAACESAQFQVSAGAGGGGVPLLVPWKRGRRHARPAVPHPPTRVCHVTHPGLLLDRGAPAHRQRVHGPPRVCAAAGVARHGQQQGVRDVRGRGGGGPQREGRGVLRAAGGVHVPHRVRQPVQPWARQQPVGGQHGVQRRGLLLCARGTLPRPPLLAPPPLPALHSLAPAPPSLRATCPPSTLAWHGPHLGAL